MKIKSEKAEEIDLRFKEKTKFEGIIKTLED